MEYISVSRNNKTKAKLTIRVELVDTKIYSDSAFEDDSDSNYQPSHYGSLRRSSKTYIEPQVQSLI